MILVSVPVDRTGREGDGMGEVVQLDNRRRASDVSRLEALVFEMLLHSRGIAWRRPRSARGDVARLPGRR